MAISCRKAHNYLGLTINCLSKNGKSNANEKFGFVSVANYTSASCIENRVLSLFSPKFVEKCLISIRLDFKHSLNLLK
jgi:hypothetical protein